MLQKLYPFCWFPRQLARLPTVGVKFRQVHRGRANSPGWAGRGVCTCALRPSGPSAPSDSNVHPLARLPRVSVRQSVGSESTLPSGTDSDHPIHLKSVSWKSHQSHVQNLSKVQVRMWPCVCIQGCFWAPLLSSGGPAKWEDSGGLTPTVPGRGRGRPRRTPSLGSPGMPSEEKNTSFSCCPVFPGSVICGKSVMH